MRKNSHYLNCEAPICQNDPNPNFKKEVIWLPGEKVCRKFPYEKFQRKQLSINILVNKERFKNTSRAYTAHRLENSCI